MPQDLRNWLGVVNEKRQLTLLHRADWDLEIGAVSAMNGRRAESPALLFDEIKDYPKGSRILTCSSSNRSRLAMTFHLPACDSGLDLVRTMAEKLPAWEKDMQDFPYQAVKTGPILENVISGRDVNLFKFPVPKWHEHDGGRYIGTGDAIITKDPDTGEVNLGTYRIMAHDERTTGLFISPGKHGRMHYEKYHSVGKPCPVAMSFGHHPLINRIASSEVPPGCEYRLIGAIQGEPVRVIDEELTGLPIPADSEIVAVGWCYPGKTRIEGPFGEWTGYYASKEREAPVVEIERIYHRDNPVLLGSLPGRPPDENALFNIVKGSAVLWNTLVKSGIPDIRGIWMSEVGIQQWVVISIKQRYPGHARQAAFLASQNRPAAYHGRYVIVVDEDIDPSDTQQVLWALCTRSDPEKDIDIVRRAWSTPLDTMIRKPTNAYFSSRAIIDACKPYEWIDDFPKDISMAPEMEKSLRQKWKSIVEL
jgi:UbiD family decarboxylase